MTKWRPFDASEYLTDPALMAEYLAACLEEENPGVFLAALADVAKARGVSQIAKVTGFGRESLSKALAPGAYPRHETITLIRRWLSLPACKSPTRTLRDSVMSGQSRP